VSTGTEPTAAAGHDRLGIRSALDDPTAAAGQFAAMLLAEAMSTVTGCGPVDGIAQLATGLARRPG